jgi:hypothetical protein
MKRNIMLVSTSERLLPMSQLRPKWDSIRCSSLVMVNRDIPRMSAPAPVKREVSSLSKTMARIMIATIE